MEVKWIQLPVAHLKKWLIFLIIPVVVAIAVILWSRPSGQTDATEKLREASREHMQAKLAYLQSRNPQDMENLKQAEQFLNLASNHMTENEFQLALENAIESIKFSKKIAREPKVDAMNVPGAVKFDELIGKVLVKPAGSQEYIQATKNILLSPGDRIQTGQHASCRLYFQDGMVTVIRPNSLITIRDTVKGRQDPTGFVNLQLDTGKLTFKSAFQQNNKARVGTKAGEAKAFDESEVYVSFSALETSTDVSVYQGKAIAKAGDISKEVRVNQMITMKDDQSLGDLVDLPLPPTLIRPDNFKKFELEPGDELPILLGWETPESSSSYHVELSPNILFTEHNYENNRYFRNQIEFTNLTEGVYFWRVSCIDSKNIEGRPSDVFQFQIGQELISKMVAVDTRPPQLKVTDISVYGYTVLVSGKTERSAKVFVNGKLAILDGTTGAFNFAMNMPSAGVHQITIVAKDPAGNKSSEERSVLIDE